MALQSIINKKVIFIVLGVFATCLLVWFLGPLFSFANVAPLETTASRLVCIAVIAVVSIATVYWRYRKRKKQNQSLVDSLVGQNNPLERNLSLDAEVETLRDNLDTALETIKNSSFSSASSGSYLYELPWYMIIGPPGSGKTTLLENSDLKFPLTMENGKHSMGGVGGTRNCDWWFTEKAVLLDTAGRYTTQDSDQETDQGAWLGFLKLLKSKRPFRPINGVLVALSVKELVLSSETELNNLSLNIKHRLNELQENLGIVPPVYLLITKCDLLDGFNEFFSDLTASQRSQVWGITLPYGSIDSDDALLQFSQTELDKLVIRVNDQLLAKLHSERSTQRREKIYIFPQQLNEFQSKLLSFVNETFAFSRYRDQLQLRGVYLSSATQVGSPIDRVSRSIFSSFGFSVPKLAESSIAGKGFFINGLLNDLIFKESGLVGLDKKAEKKRIYLNKGVTVLCILMALIALSYLLLSNNVNENYISRSNEFFDTSVTESSILNQSKADLTTALPTLNAISEGIMLDNQFVGSEQLLLNSPLSQTLKISNYATNKYHILLKESLLPRLMNRLERQMHTSSRQPEQLYEILKVYLMIDNDDHYNSEEIIRWFNFDINRNLPDSVTLESRKQLLRHISALFQERPTPLPYPANSRLIKQARSIITQTPLAQRIYGRIKSTSLRNDNSFNIAVASGDQASLVFSRHSSKPLNEGISSFFTYKGYQEIFLQSISGVSGRLSSEQWVLGKSTDIRQTPENSTTLDSVHRLYLEEFTKQWDHYLSDLELKSFSSVGEALEIIDILTASDSPLERLITKVAFEVDLVKSPQEQNSSSEQQTEASTTQLEALFSTDSSIKDKSAAKSDPALFVSKHFLPIIKLAKGASEQSTERGSLSETLSQLDNLYTHLEPLALSTPNGASATQSSPLKLELQRIQNKSRRQPALMKSVLTSLTANVSDTLGTGLCSNLNAIWQNEIVPFYRQTISNRYPLNKNAIYDVAIDDFTRFYGPGGLLDRFYDQHLSAYVVKSGKQYSWQTQGSQPSCISEFALKQLSYAEYIRNSFFPNNSVTPNIVLRLTPTSVSPSIQSLSLSVGNQALNYTNGSSKRSLNSQWPGINGSSANVELLATNSADGEPYRLTIDGTWALFKFLDKGDLRQVGKSKTKFKVFYPIAGGRVQFEVDASSSINPFRNKILQAFQCPLKLN